MIKHVSHVNEVLSNACGSISIACWIIVLLPQMLEQWRLKSADGVAIGFILAWFFGDLANLVGSILGGLRPSLILLALWFCFSDTLLLLSYWYYKRIAQDNASPHLTARLRSRDAGSHGPADAETGATRPGTSPDPSTPLLHEGDLHEASNANGPAQRSNWLLSTGLPAIFVIVIATLSYFISDSASSDDSKVKSSALSETLGYISAVLYLTARIPQIVQNHRRRSVEGLSMGFFALSIVGNLTYAGQVVLYRADREWLIAYIPWLLGSLGTIVEDLIILAQFHAYKKSN